MLTWLKLLRPTTALLAAIFTVAAFKVAHLSIPWIVVATMMTLASAAMLINDWRDRYHDVPKGKNVPIKRAREFIVFMLCIWGTACALITFSFILNGIGMGVALTVIATACLLYSETRQVVLVPGVFVAATAASPALLPTTIGAEMRDVLPLFLLGFFVVLGREILKDIEDAKIDPGYKWTIPVVVGMLWSKVIAITMIAVGLGFAISISSLTIPGIVVASLQTVVLANAKGSSLKIPRTMLDLGLTIIMFSLIVA